MAVWKRYIGLCFMTYLLKLAVLNDWWMTFVSQWSAREWNQVVTPWSISDLHSKPTALIAWKLRPSDLKHDKDTLVLLPVIPDTWLPAKRLTNWMIICSPHNNCDFKAWLDNAQSKIKNLSHSITVVRGICRVHFLHTDTPPKILRWHFCTQIRWLILLEA